MRHVVRAVTRRTVVDAWGRETKFRRPQDLEVGKCYIMQNKKIVKKLLSTDELNDNANWKGDKYVL